MAAATCKQIFSMRYTQYADNGTPSLFWYQCPVNFPQILISNVPYIVPLFFNVKVNNNRNFGLVNKWYVPNEEIILKNCLFLINLGFCNDFLGLIACLHSKKDIIMSHSTLEFDINCPKLWLKFWYRPVVHVPLSPYCVY